MNSVTISILTVLAIIIVTGLVYAYKAHKETKEELVDFYLGNRAISTIVAFGTMASAVASAFMIVGLSGYFYNYGVGTLGWITFPDGLLLVLMVMFGIRYWVVNKRFNYVSPMELLGDRYQSSAVSVLATIITLVYMVPYMATQFTGVGKLVAVATNNQISYLAGVIILAVVALVFCELGGMKTVSWIDAIQLLVMYGGLILVIIWFIIVGFGDPVSMFQQVSAKSSASVSLPGPKPFFSPINYIFLSLSWIGWFITQPQIVQRYMTPKSHKAIVSYGYGVAGSMLFFASAAAVIGLGGKVLFPALKTGDEVFGAILASGMIPGPLAGLAVAAVVAASITTMNAILFVLSYLFTHDVVRAINPKMTDKTEVKWTRVILIVLTALSVLVSVKPTPLIVNLTIMTSVGTLQLFPTVVGAFFWKRGTAAGSIASMIVGIGVLLLTSYVYKTPLGINAGVWGVVAGSIVYVLVSLNTAAPIAKANEFIDYIDKELEQRFGDKPVAANSSLNMPGK